MKKGFTLIELLSVIVVLAIISVIAVPTLIGVVNNTKLNALKSSAYGLIEAGTLYHAQYDNRVNARFDISSNDITTNEANKIKYKGYIKQGVVIVSIKGQVTVCLTDGKNSVYKNYNDSEVTLVKGKTCTVPANTSIVYLNGEATIDQVDAKAILDLVGELKNEITSLKNSSGDVSLDYAHPLHVFNTSIPSGEPSDQTHALTYTATGDCYLFGELDGNQATAGQQVKINGISIANNGYFATYQSAGGSYRHPIVIPRTKLSSGDVVTVSANAPQLHIFKSLN